MVLIYLSPLCLEEAIEVGKKRHAAALAGNYWNYGAQADNVEARRIIGAISESAVSKYFRLPWDARVTLGDAPDVGGVIEVRSRPVPGPGTDLGIRPRDKDDRPYVHSLVYTADYSIRLLGWVYAREGKAIGVWHERSKCWYVSPPFRPLEELTEILPELLKKAGREGV